MQQQGYGLCQYSHPGSRPSQRGDHPQDQESDIKRTRRGGKKRRGGVAHRRRQQAYLAAQARTFEGNRAFDAQINQSQSISQPSGRNPHSNRSIQKSPLNMENMDGIPMTPSLAALTPRSRSLTIGQILLARALVSEVIGGNDRSPLSRKELEGVPTPRGPKFDECLSSPRTVSSLPRSPPLQPQLPSPAHIPAPSPNSAKKLSKEDFQALVNARVNRSISQRLSTPSLPSKPEPRKKDRFSTVYRTPGGQTISFKNNGKNTPPTPRFGGEKVAAAVDVEWSAYEAVHEPQISGTSSTVTDAWRVTPAHVEKSSGPLWSNPMIASSENMPSFSTHHFDDLNDFSFELPPQDQSTIDSTQEEEEGHFDIQFGFGFD